MQRSFFAEKLFPFFNILEKIVLVLFIVGVALSCTHTAGAQELLMISMLTFATVNFLMAYKPLAEQPGRDFKTLLVTIVNKVCYISIAVCTIGLLFYFLKFKGYQEMLLIGSLSIGSGSVVGLFLMTQVQGSTDILKPVLLRAIPLAIAAIFVLYLFGMK